MKLSEKEKQPAFKEGEQAFRDGLSEGHGPYVKGSVEGELFHDGWFHAYTKWDYERERRK